MFTLRKDDSLDAAVVQPKLEELLEATSNLLERQWPTRYSDVDQARILFYTRMRVTQNTYEAILWLSADKPVDPQRRLLVLATAPLVRTLFEELISLIFILQDIPRLIPAFVITGYTEVWRERRHALNYQDGKPEWKNYLSRLDKRLNALAKDLNLSLSQASNPRSQWPTPGRTKDEMKKHFKNSPDIPFVEYLNSWMYRSLSSDSHLSYEGLLRRGGFFATKDLKKRFGEEEFKAVYKQNLETYKMEMMWTSYTL